LNEKIKTEGGLPMSLVDSQKVTDAYDFLKDFINIKMI